MAEFNALSPREAVTDALHRVVLGFDSNDRALADLGLNTIQGWTAIDQTLSRIFELVTTHYITNVRVQLKDANTASLSTHAVAYHIRPEEAFVKEDTSYTAGGLYYLDLVKDDKDGLWKIKTWETKVSWTTGDREVVHPGA